MYHGASYSASKNGALARAPFFSQLAPGLGPGTSSLPMRCATACAMPADLMMISQSSSICQHLFTFFSTFFRHMPHFNMNWLLAGKHMVETDSQPWRG